MDDLFIDNTFTIDELTVSELSKKLKKLIENNFYYVKIRGEISNLKPSNNGHLYFSLKDETSSINIVCFRNIAQTLPPILDDGVEVIVSGRLTIYKERSNYQIITEEIKVSGEGKVAKILEERKARFEKMGYFDLVYKKSLPQYPSKMGIITSNKGAALQDVLNKIKNRFPANLYLFSVPVQGKEASLKVAEGVGYFNSLPDDKKPDILLVVRGGGSLEDLLPFSEEEVIEAVFKSKIPVVSGVGHETDTMLIDYVADARASTPTSAAEISTPDKNYVLSSLDLLEVNIFNAVKTKIKTFSQNIENKILKALQTKAYLSREKLSQIPNLKTLLASSLADKKSRFLKACQYLESANFKENLKHGYSITRNSEGKILSKISDFKEIKKIEIELLDGKVELEIASIKIKSK